MTDHQLFDIAAPGQIRNRPDVSGEFFGRHLAKMAEDAAPAYRASFAAQGMPVPQRCSTCAFRLGTVPNRCLATVQDALKCAMERKVDFACHDKDAQTPDGRHVCVGWAMVVTKAVLDERPPIPCAWKFSDGEE